MNKNTSNFVVQAIEHYTDRGGDSGMTQAIVGVTNTLEEGMQMLRDMGVKEGRVLQIFPLRQRADGKLVPVPADIFPYRAPVKKPARNMCR